MGHEPPQIDPSTADRLLSGMVAPDDAPPGFRATARLLADAATTTPTPVDAGLVAAMAEAAQSTPQPSTQPRRVRPMLAKLLTAKAAVAVGMITLTATGAAASTGALPDVAQDVVSDVAHVVGVELPTSTSKAAKDAAKEARKADKLKLDDEDDDAKPGSTATDDAEIDEPGGTATKDAKVRTDNHGKAVSEVARDDSTSGREHGKAVSEVARSDAGKPTTTTVPGTTATEDASATDDEPKAPRAERPAPGTKATRDSHRK